VDASEANSRQLVTRARKHLSEHRPRFRVDRNQQRQVLNQFLSACAVSDPSHRSAMLTGDAAVYSDGGGRVPSATNPEPACVSSSPT
jgi:RNA polymerase sigma-70 factor (ECF subfamily)